MSPFPFNVVCPIYSICSSSGKAGFGNKSVGAAGTKTLCRYFQRTGTCIWKAQDRFGIRTLHPSFAQIISDHSSSLFPQAFVLVDLPVRISTMTARSPSARAFCGRSVLSPLHPVPFPTSRILTACPTVSTFLPAEMAQTAYILMFMFHRRPKSAETL